MEFDYVCVHPTIAKFCMTTARNWALKLRNIKHSLGIELDQKEHGFVQFIPSYLRLHKAMFNNQQENKW